LDRVGFLGDKAIKREVFGVTALRDFGVNEGLEASFSLHGACEY